MAAVLSKDSGDIAAKMAEIKTGYASLWTDKGYCSADVRRPDDRANALAVVSGLAEEAQYDVITTVLTKTKNASPYMEFYVLEALCQMERYDIAKQRMLDRYKKMIQADDTTLWEKWSKLTGTRNHAWSGGPLVIMSKYFAGVRPTAAGYDTFMIKPQLTGPDTVNCVVPSVKGYIRVIEQKTDASFTLDATVPSNTTALIYIPYTDGQTVKLDGQVIYQNNQFAEADGIDFVELAGGFIVFSVQADTETQLHFEAIN